MTYKEDANFHSFHSQICVKARSNDLIDQLNTDYRRFCQLEHQEWSFVKQSDTEYAKAKDFFIKWALLNLRLEPSYEVPAAQGKCWIRVGRATLIEFDSDDVE